MDSKNLADGGEGRVFTPNTFLLRFKSFSSPTMPVFGSDASFLRTPLVLPSLSRIS